MNSRQRLDELVAALREEAQAEAKSFFLETLTNGCSETEWNLDRMESTFARMAEASGGEETAKLFILYMFGYLLVSKRIIIEQTIETPIFDESGEQVDAECSYKTIVDPRTANDALVEENCVHVGDLEFQVL